LLLTLLFATILFRVTGQTDDESPGQRAMREGSYEQALAYFTQQAAQEKAENNQEGFMKCQLMICQSYIGMGNFEEGAQTAQSILSYAGDTKGQEPLEAAALGLFGEAQLNLGRNDLALENLRKAEQLYGDEQSEGLAECLEDLGITYWNNGNAELAIQYHERALQIREELFGEDALLVGDSYNNMGLVDVEENPYLAATNFQRALSIYEKKLGENHPKVAFSLNNIALAQSKLGNFLDAIRQLQRAQGIWDSQYEGDHPNKAFTISNIGRTYQEMGSTDEAMTQQKEALQMYKRIYGPKHPEVANTHFIIASLYGNQDNWKEAVTQYQEAVYANLFNQEFEDVYELPELRDYYNADILQSALWKKAEALENLHLSKSLKPKHLSMALATVAKCDSLITQIRQLRLNDSDKLRLARQAKEIYEKGITLALDLARQPFAKSKYYEQAFSFSERSKSAVLLEAIAETAAKGFAGIPQGLLNTEDSLKDEISYLRQKLAAQSTDTEEQAWKERLFVVQSAYREFIAELESSYPRYFDLKYQSQTAGVSDLQSTLGDDEAVLSYFEGDSNIYLFYIDKKELKVITKDKDKEYLRQIVGLRNTITFKADEIFEQVSRRLYSELVPAIPKSISSLLIIPDGALATIPFEAIRSVTKGDEQGRFLIEDYTISYDYSATLHLSRLKEEKAQQAQQEVLLLAPVSFEPEQKLSTLTASAAEVEELKYLFKGQGWTVAEQIEERATEASVKSANLADYRYMHLATHGIVHESEPELSCIFLRKGQDDDGSLYAGELYNLKIDAELVTLSACETGLGKIAKGEGIVGLSRALLYAGAKNLIVSLWQVADQSTAELMIQFYQTHLTDTESSTLSASLREAKLKMLKSEDYAHPYYWAPFILVGK
ncbi:MAG: CHAT domain-containing tetratricopeptide repeat protein, partial [Bacteroidota bacterium]